ncbi:hypothetical protein EGH90_10995 [Kaistella haifensis]|nr:hypothetical protein EGH90_10995 [Kaistella haifensis]
MFSIDFDKLHCRKLGFNIGNTIIIRVIVYRYNSNGNIRIKNAGKAVFNPVVLYTIINYDNAENIHLLFNTDLGFRIFINPQWCNYI